MKKKHLAMATAAILLAPTVGGYTAQADTLDELNQQREQLQEKANEVKNQINDKQSSIDQLEAEKANLQTKVAELQKNLDELIAKLQEQEAKLEEINAKIEALQARIAELENLIAQRTEKLNSQARLIQTEASMADFVTIIASSENFGDMVGKISAVSKLVTANNDTLTQQENDKAEVEANKAQVEEEKIAAEDLKQQIIISKNNVLAQKTELDYEIARIVENVQLTQEEKSALESTQANLASQTASITQDIQTEEARIAAEKAEQERIAAEKAAQEQAAAERAASNVYAGSSQTYSAPASQGGGFIRPASGYNSSPFGYRISPVDGAYRLHGGTDIAGGGPIIASQAGTVTFAGFNNVYGYHVIIDHGVINGNHMKSLYGHMIPGLMVAPGQSVSQGQQLGIMGTTGQSTGVHLHFEIFENGVQVDPLKYISL